MASRVLLEERIHEGDKPLNESHDERTVLSSGRDALVGMTCVRITTTLRNYLAISSWQCSQETTDFPPEVAMQTQQNFLILTAIVQIRKWAAYPIVYAGSLSVGPLGYFYISQVGQSGQSDNNFSPLQGLISRGIKVGRIFTVREQLVLHTQRSVEKIAED